MAGPAVGSASRRSFVQVFLDVIRLASWALCLLSRAVAAGLYRVRCLRLWYGDGGGSAAGTAAAGVHGFPVVLTSFVGREQAVREVAGLLEEYRLVTVTGPGGVGKTRLAGEVAGRVAGRFADGVWLAELAPVRDPEQVRCGGGGGAGGARAGRGAGGGGIYAGAGPAAAAGGAGQLRACDRRGRCSCARACCRPVMTCGSWPPAGSRCGSRARRRTGWRRCRCPARATPVMRSRGAVALFADRARAADAGFALTGQNRADVARLVGRLDGMPLAIELAAARAEALGVSQLLESLDGRLGLLGGGDRLAAGRHRSLAAAAEWSYQLLDEDERRVFRRLSVFPAPFTLEAAEAVAGERAAPAVLRLVECSLLVPPRPGPDGRSRYAMLETLRGYGAGLLAGAGEQDQAEAALARYAVRVAEAGRGGDDDHRRGAGRGPVAGRRGRHHGARAGLGGRARPGHGGAAGDRAGHVVGAARPAGRPGAAAARAGRARRARQRRVVRRAVLARLDRVRRGRPARRRCSDAPRSSTSSGTGSRPGCWRTAWPCSRRSWPTWAGSRRRPQPAAAPWPWPASWATRSARSLATAGLVIAACYAGDLDDAAPAGPAGRADPGHPRHGRPGMRLPAGRGAGRGRGPGRRRAGLRRHAGPGPGRGRPE